jgi:hypothetical protein
MNHVIFVTLYHDDVYFEDNALVAELIRNLPSSVTSIHVPNSHRLPQAAIQRDPGPPLFINDYHGSNKIETFLYDNQSQLERTRRTHVFIETVAGYFRPSINPAQASIELSPGSKIALSFFGPSSGNLVLILTHSSLDATATLILRESHGSHWHPFEYTVPSSLTFTTKTITLSPTNHPSFVPNTRNNLIIEVAQGIPRGYVVQDIRLHDEVGNDYNAVSPRHDDGDNEITTHVCILSFLIIASWSDLDIHNRMIRRSVRMYELHSCEDRLEAHRPRKVIFGFDPDDEPEGDEGALPVEPAA